MVLWLLTLVWNRARTARLAAGALVIAYAVECSQLYHAPWINTIRATRLGALALGTDFVWSDLVCYTVGVGIGAAIDLFVIRRAPHAD